MEVVAMSTDQTKVVLSDEEMGYLEEAFLFLSKHPTFGDTSYVAALGRLHGEFGMLVQLRALADTQKAGDAE